MSTLKPDHEPELDYAATHVSAADGSDAMLVRQTATTITLVNEDGYEWTDPAEQWLSVSTTAATEGNDG